MLWKKVIAVVFSGKDKVQGGLVSCFLKAALEMCLLGSFACSLLVLRQSILLSFTCCWCKTKPVSLHRSQWKDWLWFGSWISTWWSLQLKFFWCLLDMKHNHTEKHCLPSGVSGLWNFFGGVFCCCSFWVFNCKTGVCCGLDRGMPFPFLSDLSMSGPWLPVLWGWTKAVPPELCCRDSSQQLLHRCPLCIFALHCDGVPVELLFLARLLKRYWKSRAASEDMEGFASWASSIGTTHLLMVQW